MDFTSFRRNYSTGSGRGQGGVELLAQPRRAAGIADKVPLISS